MQEFVGIKVVRAEEAYKDGKKGYRVVYPDGYESWSPDDVFHKHYLLLDTDRYNDTVVALSTVNKLCGDIDVDEFEDIKIMATKLINGYTIARCSPLRNNVDEYEENEEFEEYVAEKLREYMEFVISWGRNGLKR